MSFCAVSVIVPVYNTAAYFRECLDSVLGQSLRDIEVLCVDDGSTDASPAILREYAGRDSRLRVLSQANVGPGLARNAALKLATGRYLAFCDADDIMEPGALEKAFRAAEREDSDIVVFGHRLFDSATRKTLAVHAFSGDLVGEGARGFVTWTPEELGGRIFTDVGHAMWDKLFRRSFVEAKDIRCQEQRRVEDLYFADKALLCARRITFLPDVLYDYRKGVSSVTTRSELAGLCFKGFASVRDLLEERGDFALFAPKFLEHVVYSFVEELRSVTDKAVLKAIYQRFRDGLESVMSREDLCEFLENPYWLTVYDLALSSRAPGEIRRTVLRMERNRLDGKIERKGGAMEWLRRGIKYLLLIPIRMVGLPRLYRRCVRIDERLAAAEERLTTVERLLFGAEAGTYVAEMRERVTKSERDLTQELEMTVRALEANLRAIRRGDPMP